MPVAASDDPDRAGLCAELTDTSTSHPHLLRAPVLAGAPLDGAGVAAVLVHGRGQDAAYLIEHLVDRLDAPGVAFVLPEAAEHSWYPGRYTEPPEVNEPWLWAALAAVSAAIDRVSAAGIPHGRLVLGGFSQGACLVAEHLVRHPAPYAGVAVLTGALIGPEGATTPVPRLDGVPVFMATGRFDEWVALSHVEATARELADAGARVTLTVSDEPEHQIDAAAVAGVQSLLDAMPAR
jgi:phospholipase/carboxylesterase